MAVSSASVVNNPAPASEAASVSLGVTFAKTARGLYIGGGGNATLVMENGDEVAFAGLLAGTILPVRCTQVKSGATATNLVALF